MATVSNVQEALRYTYGASKVAHIGYKETVTWSHLSDNKKPMGGRGQGIIPLWTQNPGAFTGIGEGGSLPTGLDPDTAEATFGLTEYVAVYTVSWKLLQDARSDKYAFKRAIELMDEGLKRRIFRNLNSDLLGTGKGELAILPAADDETTVTVNALPRVDKGQVVDVMDASDDDTKLEDSATVTAVDVINRTITLSGAPGSTAAGDYVVIQDTTDVSVNGAGNARHSNGLLGIIDSADPAAIVGDYGGIDRGTAGNEFWQGVELGNSGVNRPLTEDLLIQGVDSVREKGGGKLNKLFMNLAIARRYHEMLRADTIVTLNSPAELGGGLGRKAMSQDGRGKTPYTFDGIDIYVEPDAFANVVYGFDSTHFMLGHGENEVPRPISEIFDNVPFFKQTSSATFDVVWYYQMELVCDNPSAGMKITDVAES